jgi:hypothetical protein
MLDIIHKKIVKPYIAKIFNHVFQVTLFVTFRKVYSCLSEGWNHVDFFENMVYFYRKSNRLSI